MTRITLDTALRNQLECVRSCVELCDADGQTVGYFTPASGQPLVPEVSEEELDRREAEEETFSTSEVKAYLDNL
jgi:hypothetical protein